VLELVEQRHEVPEVAAEAVQGGDSDEIEPAPAGIGQELIETGSLLSSAADGVVGDLADDRPQQGDRVAAAAQRVELL